MPNPDTRVHETLHNIRNIQSCYSPTHSFANQILWPIWSLLWIHSNSFSI